MRIGREIERLRQRVHELSIEKDPLTLRMVIVKDEETHQELSDWDLRVTVERKKKKKKKSITEIKDKRNGRPTIKEIPLPPHVQRELVLIGNG